MRKRLPLTLALLVLLPLLSSGTVSTARGAGGKVGPDCSFKGKKLYGKFKIVDTFPDLKVQVVDAFPDLKVQVVNAFPDKCGKWKMVDTFPDVKIKMVTSFPDLKIKYVNAFPGLP